MKSKPVIALLKFTLLEILRTRLWVFALLLVAAVFAIAEFTASLAITESIEYRIVSFASIARLVAVLIFSLFVCNSVVRDFEDGVFDLLLSRPLSRGGWYLAKLGGYLIAALFFVSLLVAPLIYFGAMNCGIWLIAMFAELAIIVAAALAFAITIQNATVAAILVIAFYVLSRVIGAIVLMSTRSVSQVAETSNLVMHRVSESLAYLLPDFSYFASPDMLIDNTAHLPSLLSGPSILIQTLVYVSLLSFIGLFDLYRRSA